MNYGRLQERKDTLCNRNRQFPPRGPPLVFKTQTHCENPLSKEFWKRIGEREGERRKKGIGGIGEGPPSTMLGGWFPKTVRRW
jgi:hypothetical protein